MGQRDPGIGTLPAPVAGGAFGMPRQQVAQLPAGTQYNFQAAEGFSFDNNLAYGQGRTRVDYQQFSLEADRMVVDFLSGDIQAEGNVIFRGPDEFIRATSGRYNFLISEGVAYDVNGQSGDVYFRALWDENENGPAFRQIDDQTSIFRGSYFTTNPFPVPMYYVTATEIIYVKQDRVFFRNPVLWIRGAPVLWLPFYSRSLKEGSPWSNEFGYSSNFGAYWIIGYRYSHKVQTPSWQDPSKYEIKSAGRADTHLDILGRRGIGLGTRYRYQFDYYRHVGYLEVYGLRDKLRDTKNFDKVLPDTNLDGVVDDLDGSIEESDDEFRWVYRHKHFSALTRNLSLQYEADLASDPDVYYDALDAFQPDSSFERGRLYEQFIRGAITYRDRDWVARVLLERRSRLARDFYQDATDPFSDDLDFDPDPVFTDEFEYDDEDGIPRRRYADVRKNISGRYATRLLNLAQTPIFYRFEANAFDSLDAGMNRHSPSDDTRVRGLDLYGALTHRLKMGPRTTWTNTLGAGAALYERQSDKLISDKDFKTITPMPGGGFFFQEGLLPDGTINPDYIVTPGYGFTEDGTPIVPFGVRAPDQETVFLGESDTTVSPNDVNSAYLFADYKSRLNHRFTDFLDGYIQYRIRQGTNDSLGEFYEQLGRTEAFEDIHDFYTDIHTIEGGLNFYLRYPNLFASIFARENLQSGDDIYANEQIRYVGSGITYLNPTNEFRASVTAGYDVRQIRDRSDPNEYEQETLSGALQLSYIPRHARYWAALDIVGSHALEEDPVIRDVRQRDRFDENDTDITIAPTIGRRFGPKYRVQLSAAYNTKYSYFQRVGVTVLRDLHDAELGLFVGMRGNTTETRRDDSDVDPEDFDKKTVDRDVEYEYDIRASIRFKIGRDEPGLGQRSITTLADLQRESQYVQ